MRVLVATLVLLILPSVAGAQPVPPRPPQAVPAPQAPPRATVPHATPPHAPPRAASAPAHPTPVVRPRPGAPAQHPPARPRPPAHPAPPAPAPVPVPVPVPAEPEKPAEPAKGSNTGLPLPRFAALRSEEVNFRTGPGVRYPIEWVYKRRDLPVQIEREFEVWRLVLDAEGVKGWVHQATLAPRRTAIVTGGERVLRAYADDTSSQVARLKPGVIVRLRSCDAASPWCQVQVQDYRGWLKRSDFWGTFPAEAVQ